MLAAGDASRTTHRVIEPTDKPTFILLLFYMVGRRFVEQNKLPALILYNV